MPFVASSTTRTASGPATNRYSWFVRWLTRPTFSPLGLWIPIGAREVSLWGDGTPTREFLYVDDAADAILLASERYDGVDPVNVGSGEEIRIDELARHVALAVGFTGSIVWDTTKPNGQPRRALDTSRAAATFGFRAHTPFDAGLRETVAWYRANHDRR